VSDNRWTKKGYNVTHITDSRIDIVKTLLAKGADVNLEDDDLIILKLAEGRDT
jgi:hypothetical protein